MFPFVYLSIDIWNWWVYKWNENCAQFLFSALSPENDGMVMFLFLNRFEGWSSNRQSRTTGFVSAPVRDTLPTLQAFDQGQSFSTDIARQQLPLSRQRVREWPRVRDSAPSRSLLLSDCREAGSPAEACLCTASLLVLPAVLVRVLMPRFAF